MKHKRNLTSIIKLVILLMALTLGAGCSTTKTVYVLDQLEYMPVSKGQVVTVPFDGTFYSDRAEQRIMKVKVDDIKRD